MYDAADATTAPQKGPRVRPILREAGTLLNQDAALLQAELDEAARRLRTGMNAGLLAAGLATVSAAAMTAALTLALTALLPAWLAAAASGGLVAVISAALFVYSRRKTNPNTLMPHRFKRAVSSQIHMIELMLKEFTHDLPDTRSHRTGRPDDAEPAPPQGGRTARVH